MSKSGLVLGWGLLLQGLVAGCMAQNAGITESDDLTLPGVEVGQTGVLQKISGYKGDVLGAEVVSISPGEDNLSEVIELVVPIDPDLADRAIVVSPSGKPLKSEDQVEISRDVENDKVGITIKLSKKSRLGFRIKLFDVPDE